MGNNAAKYNNIIELKVLSNGRCYKLLRASHKDGFFDIQDCPPLVDGRGKNLGVTDGFFPDAIFYTNEEVADLITAQEKRQQLLERAETSLKDYVRFRNSWFNAPPSGKSINKKKTGKLRLQKQEAL